MKASAIYGPQPIKLDTFSDTVVTITGRISAVEARRFDSGDKIVLTLDDEWSLVVNSTNYRVICAKYGDETDDWIGRPITAYKGTLYYNGNEQPGICVRIPDPPPEEAPPLPKGNGADDFQDDIPF